MSDLSDAITERAEVARTGGSTVYDLIKGTLSSDRQREEFANALGGSMAPERFVRVALTEIRRNPKLLTASRESLLGALMVSAQLGLEPGGPLGHLYLVPYSGQITVIPGYKGLIALAAREGIAIDAHAVHRGDRFEYAYGLRPYLEHIPADDDSEEITHVWAVARAGSNRWMRVLTKSQVEQYRTRSFSKNAGPWVTDYEPMAIKTVIRRLFSVVPVQAGSRFAEAIGLEDGDRSLPARRPIIDLPLPEDLEETEEPLEEDSPGTDVPAEDEESVTSDPGGSDSADLEDSNAEQPLEDPAEVIAFEAEDSPLFDVPLEAASEPSKPPTEQEDSVATSVATESGEATTEPPGEPWTELADLLAKPLHRNTPTLEIRRRVERLFELMDEVEIPRWTAGALGRALRKRGVADLDSMDRFELQMFAATSLDSAREAITATTET